MAQSLGRPTGNTGIVSTSQRSGYVRCGKHVKYFAKTLTLLMKLVNWRTFVTTVKAYKVTLHIVVVVFGGCATDVAVAAVVIIQ